MFQYPRRIEPLVQRRYLRIARADVAGFSILVGSSLWCNLFVDWPASTFSIGFSILVGSSLWCNIGGKRDGRT